MSQEEFDPYRVLGLNRGEDIVRVKERFRELSRVFHPDKQAYQNYDLTKQIFQEIDTAYKMISTQFNCAVYENFGPIAASLVIEHPEKFRVFEKQMNSIQDRKQFNKLMKKIRTYLLEVYQDSLEKKLYLQTFLKNDMESELQLGQSLFDDSLYLKQSRLFQVKQSNSIHILIPEYLGFSQELYFFTSHAQNTNGVMNAVQEFGQRATRKFDIQEIGIIDLRTQIGIADQSLVGSFEIDKSINKNINLGFQQRYGQNQFSSAFTFSYQDEKQENQFKLSFSDNGSIMVNNILQFPWGSFEIHSDDHGFNISPTIYVHKHKYFRTSIVPLIKVQYSQNAITLQFLLRSSLKWMISKMIILELRSTVGLGKNQIQIIFMRGHSKISIPLSLDSEFSLLRSIVLLGIPFILPLCWNRNLIKPNWEHKILKNIERRRSEFEQQLKNCQIVQERILNDPEYQRKLNHEIQMNGLIIEFAIIGLSNDIIEIYQKDQIDILDDSHIVSIKQQIQLFVMDSHLVVKAGTVPSLPGVFLLDPQISIDSYRGIIQYRFRGKLEKKIWSLGQDLQIGQCISRLGQFSLNQILIKLLF